MKTRNGFVSNSSSSSFVILGVEVKLNDIDVQDLKSKEYEYVAESGMQGESGPIFVEIKNKKMLDLLKRAHDGEFDNLDNNVHAYKAYYCSFSEGGDGETIDISNFPKKIEVYSGEADQCSFALDVDEMEAMYKGEY